MSGSLAGGVQYRRACPECEYEGELKLVLDPRPSTRKTFICPSCLTEIRP